MTSKPDLLNKFRRKESIFSNYYEANRYYHNSEHIEHCLYELSSLILSSEEHETLQTAILFHDIIFNKNGEQDVNDSINEVMKYGGISNKKEVCELLAITNYKRAPVAKLERYMHDIDMSILGLSPMEYWHYSKMIRKEYEHMEESVFKEERILFLTSLMNKDYIYYSNNFRLQYENKARKNIERELSEIQNS